MNYKLHYEKLIERARDRQLTGYVERHHVIPSCLDGGNEQTNIVALTAEEHYVAHQLLVKIYPSVSGLVWAAIRQARYAPTNRAYGWLRRKNSLHQKGKKRPAHTAETKAKISLAHAGKVISEEARSKISCAHKGKVLSQKHKEKIGAAFRGRKFGPMSDERKARISAAKIGTKMPPRSAEYRAKLSIAAKSRWMTP